MSYTKNHAQITRVSDGVIGTIANELFEAYFSGMTDVEVATALDLTAYQVTNIRKGQHLVFRDLVEICAAVGLDIGISIRDPEGKEITCYPPENFGPNSDLPVVSKPAVEAPPQTALPPVTETDDWGD